MNPARRCAIDLALGGRGGAPLVLPPERAEECEVFILAPTDLVDDHEIPTSGPPLDAPPAA